MNWPAYQYLLAMPIVALVLLLVVGWRSSRLTQESARRTPDVRGASMWALGTGDGAHIIPDVSIAPSF